MRRAHSLSIMCLNTNKLMNQKEPKKNTERLFYGQKIQKK